MSDLFLCCAVFCVSKILEEKCVGVKCLADRILDGYGHAQARHDDLLTAKLHPVRHSTVGTYEKDDDVCHARGIACVPLWLEIRRVQSGNALEWYSLSREVP